MKKLLLTCDHVFDVLTRGPFPTGDDSDEQVEHHLRACHDCRQLAEALRPAVELLHEVVSKDQALDLPEYQGSLPDANPAPPRLSVVRLAKPPLVPKVNSLVPRTPPGSALARGSRLAALAASLLLIGLSVWLAGFRAEPGNRAGQNKSPLLASIHRWLAPAPATTIEIPSGIPSEPGLLTLASLNLPAACLPLTHRPLSQEHAAQIALSLLDGSLEKLRCCTECHHAGQQPTDNERDTASKKKPTPALASVAAQNCQTCHRG